MTGLHGLHVVAGLVLMVVVLGRLAQGAYRDGNVDGMHAAAYYWHFVDVRLDRAVPDPLPAAVRR